MWVRFSKARSWRMGPTAVAKLTLPRLAHPCIAVLSTSVRMYANGAILWAKSWTWSKRAASSRSLMVLSLIGLEFATSRTCVDSEKGDFQTNHRPSGSWQTPPIPNPEASVDPSRVGGEGFQLVEGFRAGHEFLNELPPGTQFIMNYG